MFPTGRDIISHLEMLPVNYNISVEVWGENDPLLLFVFCKETNKAFFLSLMRARAMKSTCDQRLIGRHTLGSTQQPSIF